jgi:UDP-N-acetylglucosamine transferase subunit ALG13
VRLVYPRDVVPVLRNLDVALNLLRRHRYAHVIGSGNVALSFLPVAPAFGIGAHFIESVTRTDAPSLTGKLLAPLPGVHGYTQLPVAWGRGWRHRGSVYDSFERCEKSAPAGGPLRIVVTLGLNPFPFRRLLERLVAVLPPDSEVLWQTGTTDASGLPIEARETLPSHELDAAIAAADVVIAHAGVGSSLQALTNGRIPVLVPRRGDLGEQVDEHQFGLADHLAEMGLALVVDADELTLDHVHAAAGLLARRRGDPPPFRLSA